MKRLTAIFLSVLMLLSLTVSGLSAFAAEEEVKLIATDSEPISLKEVEATKYSPWFDLESSEIDYCFNVILPDGSVQELDTEYEIGIDEDASESKIPAETKAADRYYAHGFAFVKFDEAAEAKASGSYIVPVHVDVNVSVYSAEKNAYVSYGVYRFTVYKRLVESYIRSITPVSGAPAYIYEKSDAVNFEGTEFEIEYWDFSKKTVKAEMLTPVYVRPAYKLNDIFIRYAVNRDTKKIYVSYVDGTCMFDYKTEREFPFSSVELLGCTIEGDMPTSINYCIKWKSGRTQDYTVKVDTYSGYIGYVEGYAVRFSTEGSRFTSTVTVTVGEELSDSKTYEAEQQGFFASILAKIVLFIKKVFSTVF